MSALASSLAFAFGQLADGRVLRILLKSMAVTLVTFTMLAGVGWWGFDALLNVAGLTDELFAGAGTLRGLASVILAFFGLWLLWRIVAMGVIQFYAEDVVNAIEDKYYPNAAQNRRDVPVSEQLQSAAKATIRALVANLIALPFAAILLFTGIGTAAVFWIVNAVLIGRELQDMVWLKQSQGKVEAAPMDRIQRFLLGGAITALLSLPFVTFLAPVIGAASATHLIHRNDARARI